MNTNSIPKNRTKWVLGALLMLAGMVAPVVVDDTTAHAATGPVTDGTPSDCQPDWNPSPSDVPPERASVCVYEGVSVCPTLPWDPDQTMTRSAATPELCQITIRRARDTVPYNACRAAGGVLGGSRFNNQTCTSRAVAVCPADTYPIEGSEDHDCRGVQRRTWTCSAGGIPRNQFNTCYHKPSPQQGVPSDVPACDIGSPVFAILDCESYAGDDITTQPAALDCADGNHFGTGTATNMRAPAAAGDASEYWCEYDTALLNVDCHGANPPAGTCGTVWALCLKRASGAGGCGTVAHNIRCRSLQSDYHSSAPGDRAEPELQALRNSCSPCVVLPFEPISEHCPDTLTSDLLGTAVRHGTTTRAGIIHRIGEDYYHGYYACRLLAESGANPLTNRGCAERPVCQDPPSGELDWASVHGSRLAVVNSPIVFTVSGIPYRESVVPRYALLLHAAGPWEDGPRSNYNPAADYQNFFMQPTRKQYLHHATESEELSPDSVVRTGIRSPRYRDSNQSTIGFGECVAKERPEFRLAIEELWPATDRAAIEELFGSDSLDWWDALTPTQQQTRTDTRPQAVTTETYCSQNVDSEGNPVAGISCRWVPSRSGYYRVTAAGAWWMDQILGQKRWLYEENWRGDPVFAHDLSPTVRLRRGLPQRSPARALDGLLNFFDYLDHGLAHHGSAFAQYGPLDGTCPDGQDGARWTTGSRNGEWRGQRWMLDKDCIIEHLGETFSDLTDISPAAAIGLRDDLSGLLPLPPDTSPEALYATTEGRYLCLGEYAIDLRIDCGLGRGAVSANYTETTPVGILVHEVRVVTRAPS